MFKKINPRENFAEQEEQTLKFWKDRKIFEKSIESRPEDNHYSFLDGPPFVTGMPHYGHLVGRIAKDVVPRYQTMRGKRVRRVWGWDCHGLPIEQKVEKKLGFKNRRDIEKFGINNFLKECRKYVDEVSSEWEWYVDKIGEWIDFKGAYKTMNMDYMESVIWVFKQLHEKGLIYEGTKALLYCTRCGTPISKFEIAMDDSYTDMEDPAVTVKFKVSTEGKFKDAYILAWTTTPWTLPSNRALAVDEKEDYVLIEYKGEKLIAAKKRLEYVFDEKFLGEEKYKTWETFKGKELLGLEYEAPYDYFKPNDNDLKVYSYKGMVHMEEGTGIVHSAPGFGEIDTEMGQNIGLTIMYSVDEEGKFIDKVEKFKGVYVKEADKEIIEDLKARNLLLKVEQITHRYPFCYRCETPLIQRAQPGWFIDIKKIKPKLKELAEKINWIPDKIKKRFDNNLDEAPDWNISRTRYWATIMPIWKCDKCDEKEIFGSIKEIEERSGQKVENLHRDGVDHIEFKCKKCEGKMKRVPEVLDVWMDSASMPYGQIHYPFENKDLFGHTFPGDYIVEYTGQIRAWFYVMHVISTALLDEISFKNAVVTGVMAGTDGRKMSKMYGNYPDPKVTLEKYGGDALRLYFMGSPIMLAEDPSFNEGEIMNQTRGVVLPLWNSLSFLVTYANLHNWSPNNSLVSNIFVDQKPELETYEYKVPIKLENNLDKWIVARLQMAIRNVTIAMEEYQLPAAVREFPLFLDDLSKWYIRRSRDRFAKGDMKAFDTLYYVLVEFAKLLAPFAPFISEAAYNLLVKDQLEDIEESIHLTLFPQDDLKFIEENAELLKEMNIVRDIVNIGQAARVASGVKVRQPLSDLYVKSDEEYAKDNELAEWMKELIKDELNVKEVTEVHEFPKADGWVTEEAMNGHLVVSLNTNLTEELKREGMLREIVRTVQATRKKQGLKIGDKIKLQVFTDSKALKELFMILNEEIKQGVSADEIMTTKVPLKNEIDLNGEKLTFEIK